MSTPREIDWKSVLDGTDPRFGRFRSFLRRIPTGPRCKMCLAPFEGPGAPFMRAMGRRRWAKNPNYCGACITWLGDHPGGAEIELTFLFADVRGSTGLGEHLSPSEFSKLLNRFYEVAARAVVDRDGLVDKYVGDEIVAFFPPSFSGMDHAAVAIDAARAILAGTGHGTGREPWVPVGAGVHTGVAFVGVIGEGGVSDFTALGDTVNTTARLASAAGAGEILVSRATAAAAKLSGDGLEERHLDLRGRSEPLDVLVLHTEATATAA
jgi:adenylate cyclase